MKRFILERRTTQIERATIEAESWDDASARLKDPDTEFKLSPDHAIQENIEFIGDIDQANTKGVSNG